MKKQIYIGSKKAIASLPQGRWLASIDFKYILKNNHGAHFGFFSPLLIQYFQIRYRCTLLPNYHVVTQSSSGSRNYIHRLSQDQIRFNELHPLI
jgi:hypothetical protein